MLDPPIRRRAWHGSFARSNGSVLRGRPGRRPGRSPARRGRGSTSPTRRRPAAAQRAHIARWGYPLVLDAFQFHMTLTDGIENDPLATSAEAFFAGALEMPRRVDQLCVFIESEPGAPFMLLRRLRLQG